MQSLVDLLKVKHIGPYNHNTTSKRFLKPDGIKKARQYLIKQFLVGRSFVSVDDIHGAADSGNLRYEKFQLNSGLELILPIDVMTKNLEFSPTCGIILIFLTFVFFLRILRGRCRCYLEVQRYNRTYRMRDSRSVYLQGASGENPVNVSRSKCQ